MTDLTSGYGQLGVAEYKQTAGYPPDNIPGYIQTNSAGGALGSVPSSQSGTSVAAVEATLTTAPSYTVFLIVAIGAMAVVIFFFAKYHKR